MALADNLEFYWKFDSGTVMNDSSGAGGDLTNSGATFESSGGVLDGSGYYSFDSLDDATATLDFSWMNGSDWTLGFWWGMPSGTTFTDTTKIFLINDSSDKFILWNSSSSNAVYPEINNSAYLSQLGVDHTDFSATNWNSFMVTKSGSTVSVYLNNVLKASHDPTAFATMTSSEAFQISESISNPDQHDFCEIAFWSKALDSSERSQWYNSGSGVDLFSAGSTGFTKTIIGVTSYTSIIGITAPSKVIGVD